MSNVFVALQKLLPQHALSRFAGRVANSRNTRLSRFVIDRFAAHYHVDMGEAAAPALDAYASFNDFFTRALAADARPLATESDALVCPADGCLSQTGIIRGETLLQAKGLGYSSTSLLTRGDLAARFDNGWYATIYLAPGDYHRVHAPIDGMVTRTIAVPGNLFSVNARTESGVRGLFARNERLIMEFETAIGAVVVVMVGAMIVASIECAFDAPSSPYLELQETAQHRPVARGQEIGRFLLGSTVIVMLPPHAITPSPDFTTGSTVKMGQALGHLNLAQAPRGQR